MSPLRSFPKLSVALIFTVALVALTPAGDAVACAVCFGDPNSPMVKGIAAGVWVLLGCIFTLLTGFASMFLYWMSRSRRLSALEPGGESADQLMDGNY